ncbi:MAG: hypothetical protein KY434_08705 [Actinobacteria bacterium]|nr:hypothetical protein [Actinomycetota bacterium]
MSLVVVALVVGLWAAIAVPRRRARADVRRAGVQGGVDDPPHEARPGPPVGWTRDVRVRRRRLIVLAGLVALACVPGLVLGSAAWAPAVVASGGLVAYLGALVRQGVRRSEARRKVLALPQRPQPPEPAWPARAMAVNAEDPRRQSG